MKKQSIEKLVDDYTGNQLLLPSIRSQASSVTGIRINYQKTKLGTASRKIVNLNDLTSELPAMTQSIFDILGAPQPSATIHLRALQLDLEHAGIDHVVTDPEVILSYEHRVIGTRRADLIVQMPSNETAVIQVTALAQITFHEMEELQFFMNAFRMNTGYLINFPLHSASPVNCHNRSTDSG